MGRRWLLATNEGYLLMGVPLRVHRGPSSTLAPSWAGLLATSESAIIGNKYVSVDRPVRRSEHCGVHSDHLNIRLLEWRRTPSISCAPPIRLFLTFATSTRCQRQRKPPLSSKRTMPLFLPPFPNGSNTTSLLACTYGPQVLSFSSGPAVGLDLHPTTQPPDHRHVL